MKRDATLKRTVITVSILLGLLLTGLLVIKLLPQLCQFEKLTEQKLEELLKSLGPWGIPAMFVLQLFQVVVPVLFAAPIQLMAGALYGAAIGTLICTTASAAGALAVFTIAKKHGIKLLPAKFQDKLSFLSGIEKSGRFPLVLAAMYLTPALPNGILPYIAARSGMSGKKFLLIVLLSCCPGTFATVYIGSGVMNGDYIQSVVMLAVMTAAGIYALMNKKKLLEELKGVQKDEAKDSGSPQK